MRFEDDEAVQCIGCDDYMLAGDDYLVFEDEAFCSEDCLAQYMVKLYRKKITYRHILSGMEKRELYQEYLADSAVDREREKRFGC